MNDSPARIQFNFIKSSLFRVVHADGIFGGLTPSGGLFMSFYGERFPIPTAISHELKGTELGGEIMTEREGRIGIIREVEVGVQLDLRVAKSLVTWLQSKIDEADELQRVNHPKQTAGTAAEVPMEDSAKGEPIQ